MTFPRMAQLATYSFLNHLKSLYPQTLANFNPWYIIAAVTFCSSNAVEEVPHVFLHALKDLQAKGAEHEEQLLLARKVRDALFKAGLTAGYPRTINSLVALQEVMPEELQETKILRSTDTPLAEYEKIGQKLFRSIYGETADVVQGLLNDSYPDMGWFSNTIGYGLVYGSTDILSPLETSYTLVASLIGGDNPRQIQWHLNGARRGGSTFEETQAVRTIAMEVASAAGVNWKHGVPEVKDVVDNVVI